MTTAATPKRSFKRTVASTVEERSPRFLLGSLALAMVISLLAGLGIGIKVGEHNKTKAKPAAVKPKKTPTSKPAGAGAKAARPPLKGTVVAKAPKLLVISTGKKRIPLILLPRTRVEVTAPAQRSDIKAGSRVLFELDGIKTSRPATTNGTGTTTTGATPTVTYTAKAILIVSGFQQGRLGSLVRSVTSDSMTFKLPSGKSLTISTAGAKVSKTVPSTRAKLFAGQHVLVKWLFFAAPAKQKAKQQTKKKTPVLARKRQRIATEIVAVTATSAFA
jgi:hypothetical protein